MWWWYPFGSAIFAFAGAPAAGLDQRVFCFAGEGELVDIGVAAVGPLIDVVDFSVVPGDIATGCGAAAFKGVQDESLVAGGDAFGAAEVEGPLGVLFVDAQVVVGVGAHPR